MIFLRYILVLALAVGLAFASFSHRIAKPVEPQLQAYLDIVGTTAEFCGDLPSNNHKNAQKGCEYCRLVGNAIIPQGDSSCIGHLTPSALVNISPFLSISIDGLPASAFGIRGPPSI